MNAYIINAKVLNAKGTIVIKKSKNVSNCCQKKTIDNIVKCALFIPESDQFRFLLCAGH